MRDKSGVFCNFWCEYCYSATPGKMLVMCNPGNTTATHCDLSQKRILYLILCKYDKSHPTVNTSLIGFRLLLGTSLPLNTPHAHLPHQRKGFRCKSAALPGLGHPVQPGTHLSQRPALALPNIYPFRALIFLPQYLLNIFSLNILQPEPFSLGAQGISSPCLALLPLPWLLQLGMQVGNDSPRGPSCPRAVTSEAVSPAGGLACQSWERFQLWHFKPLAVQSPLIAAWSHLEELALCSNLDIRGIPVM